MPDHQHRFDRIEEYLHHRAPYLLVDKICSITETQIVTQMTVDADAFFLQGHFPGAPIVPGAMMQELTTQSAGILIAAQFNPMPEYRTEDPFFNEFALGVLVKVKQARYKGFARPGDTLTVTVDLQERISEVFDFVSRVAVKDKTIMRNAFQLMNIPSRTLQGTS